MLQPFVEADQESALQSPERVKVLATGEDEAKNRKRKEAPAKLRKTIEAVWDSAKRGTMKQDDLRCGMPSPFSKCLTPGPWLEGGVMGAVVPSPLRTGILIPASSACTRALCFDEKCVCKYAANRDVIELDGLYAEFSSKLPKEWSKLPKEWCKKWPTCVRADPFTADSAIKNKNKIEGKIMLCSRSDASFEQQAKHAARAGAVGLIVVNTEDNLLKMKSSRTSVRAAIPAADFSSVTNTSLGRRKSEIPVVMIKSSDHDRVLGAGAFCIKDKGHPEAKNESEAEKAAVRAFVGDKDEQGDKDQQTYEKRRRDITTFAYKVLVEEFEIESLDITDEQWSRLRDKDIGLKMFCKPDIRKEAYFCEIEEARLNQMDDPWVKGSEWANFFLDRLQAHIKSDREKEAADKKKEAVSEAEAVRKKARDVSDLGFFLKNVLEDAVGDFEPGRLCAELQTHGIDSVQRLIQCFDPDQKVSIASSPNGTIFSNNSSELLFRLICRCCGT